MIAEVIVDIAHSDVDRTFDYILEDIRPMIGFRVVVPFGNKRIEGIIIGSKTESDIPEEKLKYVDRVIDNVPVLTEETLKLSMSLSKRFYAPLALVLRLFLPAEMRSGKVKEQFERYVNLIVPFDEAISRVRLSAVAQRVALTFLAEKGRETAREVEDVSSYSALNALYKAKIVDYEFVRRTRSPYLDLDCVDKKVTLTSFQTSALKEIRSSLCPVQLLHGVTGSGKTEVYLELIAEQLKQGKTAIMLVPEISLTPQMLSQLRGKFKDEVAILHSSLSMGERFDEWWRIRNGEAKVVVGARSAIFAPVSNIGIIIIDEEHDGSYISETNPRYSTIEVAKERASYNDCKLVLGSATPSVESYLSAKEGKYNLVEMPERVNKKPMPEFLIADMRREVRNGNNTIFSSVLREKLEETLANGNQAIIFLNRRGYSSSIICQECGYVAKCASCDVALTYHSDDNALKCHYCNARYKMLTACPECGSPYIRYNGTGTQKVVIELKKLFPSARILRMDNDTTSVKEGHNKIVKKFADREADILVGTQMVAKGHDFPSVTLVGILDADMSLHFSDYRSGERTFQLITQVAGRAGRAEDKGAVVLQTFSPQNDVLMSAIRYDYKGFFERQAQIRKATNFPPFCDILRVMVSSSSEEDAVSALRGVSGCIEDLKKENESEFLFFGKMKAPITRIENKYRYQVLMKIKSGNRELIDKIYRIALTYKSGQTLVYVEENPNNLS